MSPRRATQLGWGLFGLFLVITVASVCLIAFGPGSPDELATVAMVGFAYVGALIATRRPDNAIGWLLLAISIVLGFTAMVDSYVKAESAPLLVPFAWVSTWIWYVWLVLATIYLPLLFPNGRLLSRRWRPVLFVGAAALAVSIVGDALAPGRLDVESLRPIGNPVGLDGAEGVTDALSTAGNALAAIGFLLAAASLLVRFRRSRGNERQQLKWFAFAGLLALSGVLLAMVDVLLGGESRSGDEAGLLNVVGGIGWMTFLTATVIGIPLATGMAILRHRLYDIDVVINRTLVYGALTATLIGSYLGGVLLLQLALGPLTEDNGLAIAGSTLAVAALARPARARIQELVDRRFYRRKYDAAHTIEEFSSRLRDEVALESLSAELRGVVADTMQPAHVSLWLRGTE